MLTLIGKTGTYQLSPPKTPKGKFGGILTGERVEDRLPVSAKKLSKNPSDAELRKRRAVLSLKHPNLVPSFETIDHEGDSYLIRPFLEGTNLKTVIEKHSLHKHLSPSFYIHAAINILNGLQHLHECGLIHRDIKPSNIIVAHEAKAHPSSWEANKVVLIDFEQACVYSIATAERAPFAMVYSAPEQLLNHNELVCPASDLFALGVTLFELLSGSAPWVDCNAEVLLHLQLTYPIKKRPGIDAPMLEILAKAAYKAPFKLPPRRLASDVIVEILKTGIAQRYQSAAELQHDLETYLHENPISEKKSWMDKLFAR